MGKIRELLRITLTVLRQQQTWIVILVTALVSATFNVGGTYWLDIHKTKVASQIISDDIEQHIHFLERLLTNNSNLFLDININHSNGQISITNFMLPDSGIWSHFDEDLLKRYIQDINTLPKKSVSSILTYYRFARISKTDFTQFNADLKAIFKDEEKKNVFRAPDGANSLQEDMKAIAQLQIYATIYNYFSLRLGIVHTISSGYDALSALNNQIFGDDVRGQSYEHGKYLYKDIVLQEEQRVAAVRKIFIARGTGFVNKVFQKIPDSIQKFVLEMGTEYAKELPQG